MKNAEICSPCAAPYEIENPGPATFNASVTYTLTARGEFKTDDYYIESKTGRRVYEGDAVEDFEFINYTPKKALRDYADVLQEAIESEKIFISTAEREIVKYEERFAGEGGGANIASLRELKRLAKTRLDTYRARLAAIQSWVIKVEDYEVED